jgi:vacuolar protein-sorting-associated protein 4
MVKLHLGDTPNSLSESDFEKLGQVTDGASGSDIKILVKEALMQPLRTCQKAQQYKPDKDGFLIPCEIYPNCPSCPMKLSSDVKGKDYTCKKCGAVRMTLWDVPPEKLKAPDLSFGDFDKVLKHAFSSVSPEELERFNTWTKQFGQEGA